MVVYLSLGLLVIALVAVLCGWGAEIDHQRKGHPMTTNAIGEVPRMVELVEIVAYTDCPSCHGIDAAVWLDAEGLHVLDCSECGYGAVVTREVSR